MTFHMGIFILQKTFKIKSAFHSLFQSRDFATSLKLLVIPWVTGVRVESHQAIQVKRRAGPRDARMKNGQRNRKCSSWIYGQSTKTNWRAHRVENTGRKLKIEERLNNRFQGSWSKDQIQRKIRYLKEQFKKASDWNRRQTGGNRKTSPHYEKISEIMGKKDSVTFKHVISAGNPTIPPTEDEDTGETPEIKSSESEGGKEMTIKAKAAKYGRKERKLKRCPTVKAEMNDEEDSKRAKKFDETMDSLRNQGTKITDTMESIVTSIQDNQREQVQFMGEFMKIFAEMAKK